jgi:hypothetical protein
VCPGSLDEERKRIDAFEAKAETEAFGHGLGTAEGAGNLPAKRSRYTDESCFPQRAGSRAFRRARGAASRPPRLAGRPSSESKKGEEASSTSSLHLQQVTCTRLA